MPDQARAGLTFGDEQGIAGELLDLISRGRPAWMADAACREAPPDVTWFPELGQDGRPAKRVCEGCLVTDECRAWSLTQDSLEGVWGGLSKAERATVKRGRRAA